MDPFDDVVQRRKNESKGNFALLIEKKAKMIITHVVWGSFESHSFTRLLQSQYNGTVNNDVSSHLTYSLRSAWWYGH